MKWEGGRERESERSGESDTSNSYMYACMHAWSQIVVEMSSCGLVLCTYVSVWHSECISRSNKNHLHHKLMFDGVSFTKSSHTHRHRRV